MQKLPRLLAWTNSFGLVAAAALAARGAVQPGFSTPATSPSERVRFWALASAIRTWGLSIVLMRNGLRDGPASPALLSVAGIVQFGDASLGVWRRNPAMTLLPLVMGAVHLGTARVLLKEDGIGEE